MVELDTEIDRLRAKLQGLKPGFVDDALENAAPAIARVTGLLGLVQPFVPMLLPLLRPKARRTAAAPQPAVQAARTVAPLERGWRPPTWAQRNSALLAGLGVAIVLSGVAGLVWARQGASTRPR